MTYPISQNLTDDQILRMTRALSDIQRLRFMMLLAGSDEPLPVTTLADLVGIKHNLASRHLQILAIANLVHRLESGKFVLYSVNFDQVRVLRDYLAFGKREVIDGIAS